MAEKKPLALYDNEVEELRAGDSIAGATGGTSTISRTNASESSIVRGQAVYASSGSAVNLARANASGTIGVIGLVQNSSVAASATATIQTDATLTATTEEWDAVTGGTGGLNPGTEYILSPDTAGGLIPKSSTIDGGEWIVSVGRAVSATELEIYRNHPTVKRS